MRAKEAIGQRFILAQQPKQQVLRLDVRRTELAGFVPREENDATCFFRVAFEHIPPGKVLTPSRSLPCWPSIEINQSLRPVSPLPRTEDPNQKVENICTGYGFQAGCAPLHPSHFP